MRNRERWERGIAYVRAKVDRAFGHRDIQTLSGSATGSGRRDPSRRRAGRSARLTREPDRGPQAEWRGRGGIMSVTDGSDRAGTAIPERR
jgi:hypothetical protein